MSVTTHRGSRQRKRTRKRMIGAALAAVGVVLWAGFVILQFTTDDLLPDNVLYLGITIGGMAVVAGIILVATTF